MRLRLPLPHHRVAAIPAMPLGRHHDRRRLATFHSHRARLDSTTSSPSSNAARLATLPEHLRLSKLIREYEHNGHFMADVDPLRLNRITLHGKAPRVENLRKESYGFTDADLSTLTFSTLEEPALLADFRGRDATLGEILQTLERAYSSRLGIEFAHIVNPRKVEWIRENVIHIPSRFVPFPRHRQLETLRLLARAQAFEEFCANKFSAATHFSLEGAEALIVGLEAAFERAAQLGVTAIEMGMAHRGRLNVLRHSLQVPLIALLDRFESYLDDLPELPNNSDDVRYHLGASVERRFHVDPSGGSQERALRISLAANPSHLEAVNGVVLGKARARQFLTSSGERIPFERLRGMGALDVSPDDAAKRSVMTLLLHGDASFFQGSVRESLGFSNLRDYTTGGTFHLIINNQIGFTTSPKQAHSSQYCSDVAKSVGSPVFHVNADAPEDVARVCASAIAYRQEFLSDVVVNLWCYRRKGHNERDTPEVTQPVMYSVIKKHPPVAKRYASEIGLRDTEAPLREARYEIEEAVGAAKLLFAPRSTTSPLTRLPSTTSTTTTGGNAAAAEEVDVESMVRSLWNERQVRDLPQHSVEIRDVEGGDDERKSGVRLSTLRQIGRALFTLPEDFTPHPKAKEVLERRARSIGEDCGDDASEAAALAHAGNEVRWDCAEALALGSLLVDGVDIRLAGQDVERGTFNQRHAVLYSSAGDDSPLESQYMPWTRLLGREIKGATRAATRRLGMLGVVNSPLSEESVLAFEHGYTLYSPAILGIWEAQFGDFANCAQTVIDAFVATGEEKWIRQSGLVLFLPHGFDGQGPDHSNAFVERFLSLASEDDEANRLKFREHDAREARRAVNMHVVNPSTPAQLFHVLRRHMIQPFRKPLVVFTPKFLLHHRPCVSRLGELGPDGFFRVVIEDGGWKAASAGVTPPQRRRKLRRLVFTSGKFYYHLAEERAKRRLEEEIALVRIEQLTPFPFFAIEEAIREELERCEDPARVSVIFAQEEPKNKGAYAYVAPRLAHVLRASTDFPKTMGEKPVTYLGRPASASPATGNYTRHIKELRRLVEKIIQV